MAVWRLMLNFWPTRARLHVAGEDACVFGCCGCPDALGHYGVCGKLWPPLFHACQLRGDPGLAVAIATGGEGRGCDVVRRFRGCPHCSSHDTRRRTAMQDALCAYVRAVRERAWPR